MPLFSIVIPTRNRARFLRGALRTALNQTYDDYEIVVCDNASTDGTEAVVSELGDGRVRYVRSPRPLSMPDNWELAVERAKGEYVTVLCDDDAVSPSLLGKLGRLVRRDRLPLVMWSGASYYDESWDDREVRNTLVVPTFTGRTITMDSDAALRGIYGLRGARLPMVVNSVFHRSLIDAVRQRAGRFFIGISPDFASGIAVLSRLPTYTLIDQILSVGGGTSDSVGMAGRRNRGEVFKRFIGEFGDQSLQERVPLKIDVQTPYLTEMYLLLKETFREELASYEIDWAQFFVNCQRELDIHERHGVDVEADRAEFKRALELQALDVRERFRSLVSIERRVTESMGRRLHCAEVGVHNIVECAEYIDRCPRPFRGIAKAWVVSLLGSRRGFSVARRLGQTLNQMVTK